MRSHFQSPPDASRPKGRLGDGAGDSSVAEALLGASHPLVGVLRGLDSVLKHAVSVAAVQAAGVVFFLGHEQPGLALAIAGVLVQLWLGFRLAVLVASRRHLCLDLIIEGRCALPLACLQRNGEGLLRPPRLGRLAGAIEEIVEVAVRPPAGVVFARPLYSVSVVRPVVPELREVARLLRADDPASRGVALVERLVTCGASPLYGAEVQPLREELGRARLLLTHELRIPLETNATG
jgi:hypothetical protein